MYHSQENTIFSNCKHML